MNLNLHREQREAEPTRNPEKGFDKRIVNYETIHNITERDVTALLDTIAAKPGQIILDGCAGYGDVARRILNRAEKQSFVPNVYILDESKVQLARAQEVLPNLPSSHIITGDIRATHLPDSFFDTVVIKMGLHELPKEEQAKAMTEIYRILTPGGSFVTWELALDNKNQTIFQNIVREKDRLAGFDILVASRYFQRLDELYALYAQAGFSDTRITHEITYRLGTWERRDELVSVERKQLEQTKTLTQDDENMLHEKAERKAEQLAEYAREQISPEQRQHMDFTDLGHSIEFSVRKVIMKGYK